MNSDFELIEDSDLNLEGGHKRMILYCPDCLALFSSKAIAGRSIFPFFGYHPDDGNLNVLTDETRRIIERRADLCHCNARLKRVTRVTQLTDLINKNKKEAN